MPHPSPTSELSSRSPERTPGTSRSSGVAQDADGSDPDPAERIVRTELAALVERSRGASYFEVLGLGTPPSDEEVRQAYADLAKRTHPDRFPHSSAAVRSLAEEAFAIVARAYEGLSDATRRAAYRLDRRKQEAEAAELEEGHRALRAELEFQKGEGRLRSRDYQGALESFQWALDLYPEEGEYHAYVGWASYLARGKTPEARKEALRHLRRAAKLAPDREKPYLFLGRLYREAGRADVAERAFARALQLQPDCVEALRELRLIEMRRQKTKGLIARIFRRSGQAEAKRWPREARPG
jgi:curved DNA-binding protein CbpA